MKTLEQAFADYKVCTLAPTTAELELLFNTTRKFQPYGIIEIGSGPGTATLFLHEGCPTTPINSFDLYTSPYGINELAVGSSFHASKPTAPENVKYITGMVGKHVSNLKYNMIYQDAEHMHPCPFIDTLIAISAADPGPLVIGVHDTNNYEYSFMYSEGGVRLWEALIKNRRCKEQTQVEKMGVALFEVDCVYEFMRDIVLDYPWKTMHSIFENSKVWAENGIAAYKHDFDQGVKNWERKKANK